jgi:type IV secretory pathway ATPase VirB11/archaellum biosynthesis ATPase
MDCPTCGLGLASSECINSHLRTISALDKLWKTMRYEEEAGCELDEEKSTVFTEYVSIVRQIEGIIIDPKTYGRPDDDYFQKRKKLLADFYEYMFMNPLLGVKILRDFKEPYPQKQLYMEGYRTFQAWVNGILATYTKCKLYRLAEKAGDMRFAFLGLLGLKSLRFMQNYLTQVPPGARLIEKEDAQYSLSHGITVKIYELEGSESHIYVQENKVLEGLSKELQDMLKETIQEGMKELREAVDYTTIFESRTREYRQKFIDTATLAKLQITQQEAAAMAREAASWVVGIGGPLENIALDVENITDIYIDSENSPIYIEHVKYGLCHTLYRYNREMLEKAFLNIMLSTEQKRKFDDSSPVIDIMLTRLMMRCHLQRPPATFGDLQAALRIMHEKPFTYPKYLEYKSFTPFFAGYDDMMVGLGCSEAVLGLKGVGKTAFISAKISAIGTKKRILPIQDIEEIPTKAYRKRGFHIGAVRVQASDKEEGGGSNELDLVSMTNAALRMGDACVVINEVRSRLAIQGVMNMLNTQPGVFLLYNLHGRSLRDIQDRLELVFGIPAASMLNTERYTFLRKVRFVRNGRLYRVLENQYETDKDKRQFFETFTYKKAKGIAESRLVCNFIENPEASAESLAGLDLAKMETTLKVKEIPPVLAKRAEEAGTDPKQYIMEAFFKAKIYSKIYDDAVRDGDTEMLEIDFVLACISEANNLLTRFEAKGGFDWAAIDKEWGGIYREIAEHDRMMREFFVKGHDGNADAGPVRKNDAKNAGMEASENEEKEDEEIDDAENEQMGPKNAKAAAKPSEKAISPSSKPAAKKK